MFVEMECEWTITVEPSCLRSPLHLKQAVLLKLMKDFDSKKCTADGYLVTLTTLELIGEERLWERSGLLAFPVRFRCIVFTLIKGEYVHAVATKISNQDIMCECGPVNKLYIPDSRLSSSYTYVNPRASKDGKVGDASNVQSGAHWQHSDGTKITTGDVLRVRIEGTKWESRKLEFQAIGTLSPEYAGKDERFPDPNARPNGNSASTGDVDEDDEGNWGGANIGGDDAWGAAPAANDDDGQMWDD